MSLPGIRGGGEYGQAWYDAGKARNRQNAIDDYHAATEWLIANGYTSPEKMVANGGSASGALVAAAVLQRPELYGAAVIDIPAFDMLRYHRHPGSGQWVQEFGDPNDPEDARKLEAALLDSTKISFLRTKNSWGTTSPESEFARDFPGYHDLWMDYLEGPIPFCPDAENPTNETCLGESTPLRTVMLPPGY